MVITVPTFGNGFDKHVVFVAPHVAPCFIERYGFGFLSRFRFYLKILFVA